MGRVAGRTLAVIVPHGRLVAVGAIGRVRVIKAGVGPAKSRVTVRALAGIVSRRRRVACQAVFQPVVLEVNIPPTVGAVALETLVVIMERLAMARLAVGVAGVVEGPVGPILGGVAGDTLPIVVIEGRGVAMALEAVGVIGVVEPGLGPVQCVVTVGALAGVVIGRAFFRVAGQTIGKAGVVEPCLLPPGDGVAVGALAGIVIFRQVLVVGVARQTVAKAGVVKVDDFPVLGVGVAIGAHVRRVWDRGRRKLWTLHVRCRPQPVPPSPVGTHIVLGWAILKVTRAALCHQRVVKRLLLPLFQVGVASIARAGIVIDRALVQVTGLALGDVQVVEFKGLPALNDVARLAIPCKVIGVDFGRGQVVAARTVGGGVCILPVGVAGQAFDLGVPPGEGKSVVLDVWVEERDRHRLRQNHAGRYQGQPLKRIALLQGKDFVFQGRHCARA